MRERVADYQQKALITTFTAIHAYISCARENIAMALRDVQDVNTSDAAYLHAAMRELDTVAIIAKDEQALLVGGQQELSRLRQKREEERREQEEAENTEEGHSGHM